MDAETAVKELLENWSQKKAEQRSMGQVQWPGGQTTQGTIVIPRPQYPPMRFARIVEWCGDVSRWQEHRPLDNTIGSVYTDSSSETSEEILSASSSLINPDGNIPANLTDTPFSTPLGETHHTFATLTTSALRRFETADDYRTYGSSYPAALSDTITGYQLVFEADPAWAEESGLACPGFYTGVDGETWPLPPIPSSAAGEDMRPSPQSAPSLSALGELWYKTCGAELGLSLTTSPTAVGAEWGVSQGKASPATPEVEQLERMSMRPASPSFSELGAQWYATFGPELGVFLQPASPIPLAASIVVTKEIKSRPESELSAPWCVGDEEEASRELAPRLGFDVAKIMHRLENLHFGKRLPAKAKSAVIPKLKRRRIHPARR